MVTDEGRHDGQVQEAMQQVQLRARLRPDGAVSGSGAAPPGSVRAMPSAAWADDVSCAQNCAPSGLRLCILFSDDELNRHHWEKRQC